MIKGIGPNKKSKYKQDLFHPKNPHKYIGSVDRIIFRSSWESVFMTWCDMQPSITKWNSEGVMVPYYSPIDKKQHRYYVDFWILIEANGQKKQYLIEIKPVAQTKLPDQKLVAKVREGSATAAQIKRYNQQLRTYIVNNAKFAAASQYAAKLGMEFKVCSESFLF
jgi:hypothetical protein